MRTNFKKSRRTIFRPEPEIEIPGYLIGDVIRKPGSERKGYILDDRIPATDGRHLLIWDKRERQLLPDRYEPKTLWVLGYEVVGHLKHEKLEEFRRVEVFGRKVIGSRQKRENMKERLLKRALKEVHRKEGKNEKDKTCKQQKHRRRMFRRSK